MNMSFLNIGCSIEPFAHEVAHFLLLSICHLSSGRIIVTKILYEMCDLAVSDLVS